MDGRQTEKQSDVKKPNSIFQQNQARIRQLFLGRNPDAVTEENQSNQPVEDLPPAVPPRDDLFTDMKVSPPSPVPEINIISSSPPPENITAPQIIAPESVPSIKIEYPETDKTNEEFQQNKEMVEKLLLDQKFQVNLRNVIREFFALQRTFHQGNNNFVHAFDNIFSSLSAQQQDDLQILLQPYCMLSANPFNDYPTGDNEEDLKHIVSVINKRNTHFVKILPAISMAVLRMDEFSKLLSEIKTDPRLKEAILQGLKSASWMDVESRVVQPNQRFMQYRLLLMTIESTIMKAMEEDLAKFGKTNKETYLSLLSPAIIYILPKLNYLNNNNQSKVILLDDMDLLLNDMLKMENIRQNADFIDKLQKVKRLLDFIIQKINFNYGDQLDHLRELWDALLDIKTISETTLQEEANKRNEQAEFESKQSYLRQGFYLAARAYTVTFYGGVYYPPGQDPREKFLELMNKLRLEIRDLEFALLGADALKILSDKMGGLSPLMRKL